MFYTVFQKNTKNIKSTMSLIIFFGLYNVFINLYLGLVGGDKTYRVEPPDPATL